MRELRSDQLNQQTELSLPGNSYTVTRNKFLIALLFTIPLFLHMFVHLNILHDPYFQLICSLPVLFIGITHFGKSAYFSIRSGVPNMDVLIVIGSTAAFVYSILGMFMANVRLRSICASYTRLAQRVNKGNKGTILAWFCWEI